uniref:Uncharacterized protein n=1 Tax=Timema genevievae TaxID=629358 RepID=A0A7R9PGY5_TIMGE|nr:unnamed protein product [Timema genevievae]
MTGRLGFESPPGPRRAATRPDESPWAMLPDKEAALLLVGDGLSGAGVLQWVAARADLWLLVFRCAQLIGKAHSSATQLEQIFRANEEEVGEENTTSGATVEVEEHESWRGQDTDWWPDFRAPVQSPRSSHNFTVFLSRGNVLNCAGGV